MKITNLSDKHVEMLDIIWNIQDVKSYYEWKSTLSKEEKQMSETLAELLVLECLDEDSNHSYFPTDEAESLLKNIFQ